MPTRSTPTRLSCNSPLQLDSANRPSSPSKGHFKRSVSDQTSKLMVPGMQRRTASVAGNVTFLDDPSSPANLPTTRSELPEEQEPIFLQSISCSITCPLQSTPRKPKTLALPRSQEATPEEARKRSSATCLDGLAASAQKSLPDPSMIISQEKTTKSTVTERQSRKSAVSSATASGNVVLVNDSFSPTSLPANQPELPEKGEPTPPKPLPRSSLKPTPRTSGSLAAGPPQEVTPEEVRKEGSTARPDRLAASGRRLVSDPSAIISQAKTSKSAVTGKPSRKSAAPSSTASGNDGLSNNPPSPINLFTTQSELPEEWEPTSFQSGPASPSTPRSSPRGKDKLVAGPLRSQENAVEVLVEKGSSGPAALSTPLRSPRGKNKLAADPPRSQENSLKELVKKGRPAHLDGPAASPSKQPPSVLLPQELTSSSPCVPLLTELRKPSASITSVGPVIADSVTIPVADCGSGLSQLSVPYFFTWSPPSRVNEMKIGRGTSRGPGFWDRHLHEKFVLKKIVSAPKLAMLLGEVADTALKQEQANHYKPDLLTGITKTSLGAVSIGHTECEAEVRDFYKDSIAPHCLAAAGILGFGTAGKFLKWEPRCNWQTKAKADGFLVVVGDGADFLTLSDESEKRIKLLEEWNLNILAIWEFKSLAAGSKDVMDAIQRLSSRKSFPWTGCTPHDHCESKHHPSGSHTPLDTGRRTSPDAKSPLGMFSRLKAEEHSRNVTPGLEDHLANDEDDINDESFSYDEDILPELPDEETPENNADETRRPSAEDPLKASHIIQQVWAEAVYNDATFMVINAGLYEFVGFRHRGTQTLYLSDMIKVSKSAPAYGKLHTGLYLAAFNDALDRALQLNNMKILGTRYNVLYRRKYPHDKVRYKHEDPIDINSQIREETMIAQQGTELFTTMYEGLKVCPKVEVLVQAKIPIFGADEAQFFYRLNGIGKPVDSESDVPNNFRLLLKPLAGSVYICDVFLGEECIPGRFVIKLAQRQEDHESLLREYKTYLELKEMGIKGVLEVYGLFRCDAPGMWRTGLVMSHGGRSLLHYNKECISQVRRKAVCEQFEAILKALKANGMAHRGLLLEHFLLNKSKGPRGPETVSLSLISWKSAKLLKGETWRDLETGDEGAIESIRTFLQKRRI